MPDATGNWNKGSSRQKPITMRKINSHEDGQYSRKVMAAENGLYKLTAIV